MVFSPNVWNPTPSATHTGVPDLTTLSEIEILEPVSGPLVYVNDTGTGPGSGDFYFLDLISGAAVLLPDVVSCSLGGNARWIKTGITSGGGGGGGGGSTVTVHYTGTPPLKGQWVCMASGADASLVVVATLANLRAAGRTRGIATKDASGGVVDITTDSGTVDTTVTGLALPGTVGIDPVTARSVLLTGKALSGAEFVGGNADLNGKLTVCQWARNLDSRSPPHFWSPLTYGAKADASINANGIISGTDDTQAWIDMQADMTDGTEVPVVYLPPRLMYLAGLFDNVHGGYYVPISKTMHLRGNGGGSTAPTPGIGSGFVLPPMTILDFSRGASLSSNLSFSHWDHISIYAKTPIVTDLSNAVVTLEMGATGDLRVAGRTYSVGMCCLKTGITLAATNPEGVDRLDPTLAGQANNDVMFRCVVGGTVVGAIPAAMLAATVASIGTTIVDGAVTWRVEALPKDRFSLTPYGVGEQVVNPGDMRFVYECVVAGVTGDNASYQANVGFIAPTAWDTFVDGSVTWRIIRCGVIHCLGNETKFTFISGMGGMGPAFHSWTGFYNTGPNANYMIGDHISLEDCRWKAGGGMLTVHGPENTHTKIMRSVYNSAAFYQRARLAAPRGCGDSQVWDRTVGGLWAQSLYCEFQYGPGFVADSSTAATATTYGSIGPPSNYFDCRQEGDLPNHIKSPVIFIGNTGAQGFSSTTNCTLVSTARTRNLTGFETDAISGKLVNWRNQVAVNGIATHIVQAGADITGSFYFGWWYERLSSSFIKTGLFMLGSQPEASLQQPRRWAFGFTNCDAKNSGGGPGPGILLMYISDGYFSRDDTRYHGTDAAALYSNRIRYGLRKVGDSFPYPSATYAIGSARRVTCTVQGTVGQRYAASPTMVFYAENDTAAQLKEALIVAPSTAPAVPNGSNRCWKLSVLGAGNLSEPAWPASGNFTDANNNQWVDMGVEATFVPYEMVFPATNEIRFQSSETSILIDQADLTTNSGTGAPFTIRAQNETGTTSTGGQLNLTSGTGTTVAGNVEIQTGGTVRQRVTPTANLFFDSAEAFRITPVSAGATTLQFASTCTAAKLFQADLTTNSGTGAALTVQAQNETGTTSTGGQLNLDSGTGTTVAGNVDIRPGGTAQLRVTPTAIVSVNSNPIQWGTGTLPNVGLLRVAQDVDVVLGGRNGAANYSLISWSSTSLIIGNNGAFGGTSPTALKLGCATNINFVYGSTTRVTTSTNGFQFFNATVDFGGGNGVIGLHDATTNPTSNATNGCIIYSTGGAATCRGSGGTVTTFGPA